MTLNELKNLMDTIRNGSIGSIEYTTDYTKKVSAPLRKSGVKVEKYTYRQCRYGIDYSNISEVKEMKELGIIGDNTNAYNWEWLNGYAEKLAHNTKTNTDALRIIALRNDNAKWVTEYRVTKADGTTEVTDKKGVSKYMISSFNNTVGGEPPITQWIKVENIISINGKSR